MHCIFVCLFYLLNTPVAINQAFVDNPTTKIPAKVNQKYEPDEYNGLKTSKSALNSVVIKLMGINKVLNTVSVLVNFSSSLADSWKNSAMTTRHDS